MCPVLRAVVGGAGGARVPSPGCGAGGNILRAPRPVVGGRETHAVVSGAAQGTSPGRVGDRRRGGADGGRTIQSDTVSVSRAVDRADRSLPRGLSFSPCPICAVREAYARGGGGGRKRLHAPSGVAPAVALQRAAVPGLSVFVLGDGELLI